MKRKKFRPQIGYSTKNVILDLLLDFGENFTLFQTPYMRMRRSFRKLSGAPELARWRYNRAMRYLQYIKDIKIEKRDDELFIKLTKRGKIRALLMRLHRDFKKSQRWDGRWRVIIWDIPESSHLQRQRIRTLIKSLGFYQLQKSVFINPNPLPQSAVHYLRESGLLNYLRFLRVDRLDDDTYLKSHYNLV